MTTMRAGVILPIAWRDPLVAFAPLAEEPLALALTSTGNQAMGRWSILCAGADDVLQGSGPGALETLRNRPPHISYGPKAAQLPFHGGWAGAIHYEFGAALEHVNGPDAPWPDLSFGRYATCALFDHQCNQAVVLAPDIVLAQRFAKRLGFADVPADPRPVLQNFKAQESDQEIAEKVQRAISLIHAGDIFQANISRSFHAELPPAVTPFQMFARWLDQSAAPFCGFFRVEQHRAILSNSPERYIHLDPNGHVQTHPIKGTRARGKTKDEDQKLALALQQSAKDRAENLMIVDLMRNDLSKVCAPGSVHVPKLFALQSFANVHHLVSHVSGQLRQGLGPVDVLRASFPAGSITGAPKIRAMQIIAELEQTPRGPYCGALGYISNHGQMDFNVLIRTAHLQQDTQNKWHACFRAGGGIVADSDPIAETCEMNDKASSFAKLAHSAPRTNPNGIQ